VFQVREYSQRTLQRLYTAMAMDHSHLLTLPGASAWRSLPNGKYRRFIFHVHFIVLVVLLAMAYVIAHRYFRLRQLRRDSLRKNKARYALSGLPTQPDTGNRRVLNLKYTSPATPR